MAGVVLMFLLLQRWLAVADDAGSCQRESCMPEQNVGTSGNSCLQKASIVKKVPDPGKVHGRRRLVTQEGLAANRTELVTITYCDANFARIWQTFMKCYEKAFGCGETGGTQCQSKPRLLDLGLIDQDSDEQHCTRTRLPAVNLAEMSAGLDEKQMLTPHHVPVLICDGIARELMKGNDVLRLDADAFLLENPMQLLQEAYPHADIVSSVDCSASKHYCEWYLGRTYRRHHRGRDPLAKVGFMMNTGLTYIRSNHRTISFVRSAARALRKGKARFEQVALNEELVRRRCRWKSEDGRSNPGRVRALNLLGQKAMIGHCADGLQVAVLPYRIATRTFRDARNAIAYHPGGITSEKMQILPEVEALCGETSSRQPGQISRQYLEMLHGGRDLQTV